MRLQTLEDLMILDLGELYSALQQILTLLPKMVEAAQARVVKDAFEEHVRVSRMQLERLDEVYRELGLTHDGQLCKGIQGVIEEGEAMVRQEADAVVRDAGLIGALQRIEHYEIAAYGTVRTYAKELGYSTVEHLLQKTLDEEGASDKALTRIATGGLFAKGINQEARER